MKRSVALLLACLLVLTLAACSQKEDPKPQDAPAAPAQTQAPEEQEAPAATAAPQEPEDEYSDWLQNRVSSVTETDTCGAILHMPMGIGATHNYGWVTMDAEGTMIYYAGEHAACPDISDVSQLLPAYNDVMEADLQAYFGIMSENFQFKVESDAPYSHPENPMHCFRGTLEYEDFGEKLSYPFVAYAAQLQGNGGYVYWVVMETGEGVTDTARIQEYALGMAKTFREEK